MSRVPCPCISIDPRHTLRSRQEVNWTALELCRSDVGRPGLAVTQWMWKCGTTLRVHTVSVALNKGMPGMISEGTHRLDDWYSEFRIEISFGSYS